MIFALLKLLPAACLLFCCEEANSRRKNQACSLGFILNPKYCASVKFSFHRVNKKKAAALLYPKDDDDVFSSSLSSFAHAWCW